MSVTFANYVEVVERLVEQIKPILAGHKPDVQGAVLADLLAMWLAGHHVAGNPAETAKLRGGILEMHLVSVEQLTAVNARMIGTEPG